MPDMGPPFAVPKRHRHSPPPPEGRGGLGSLEEAPGDEVSHAERDRLTWFQRIDIYDIYLSLVIIYFFKIYF